MTSKAVETTLGSAVAQNGTFTVNYPPGYAAGSFAAYGHAMIARGLQARFSQDEGTMSVAFTTLATVTYKGATTIPAGSVVNLDLHLVGAAESTGFLPGMKRMGVENTVRVNLGAAIVGDADGISASQSVGAGASALLNGALSAGGRMIFDVPRNVVGAWTTNSIVTVTGLDEYGDVLIEKSASAATLTGKKAFKEITSVSSSAAITGATFGTGNVLGLPLFVGAAWQLDHELEDNATITAGTFVAGVQTLPTATTGDVRGTYVPNSTPDGAKFFSLIVLAADPLYKGVDNYDG